MPYLLALTRYLNFPALLIVATLLTACAHGPSGVSTDATTRELGTRNAGRAVIALVDKAKKHELQAQWERAAALLERALRIEPRNARLWYRLASIRFQQGRYRMAESLAQKSAALTKDDEELERRNAALIEAARRAEASG